MTNREDLKVFFEAGKRPTQGQFGSLIDNTVNAVDDKATNAEIDAGTTDAKYVTVLGARRSARNSIKVNNIAADPNTGNIQLPAAEAPLTFSTGLTRSGNTVTVNNSQSINRLSNLASNGYVKTSGGDGTLAVSGTVAASDLSGAALPSSIVSSSLTSFGAAPNIGAATGTSLAVTGQVTSSSGGIGYAVGNGGAVTQSGSSKSTAVSLNKMTGDITTNTGAVAAGAVVTFTLSNSMIGANDVIHLQHQSGGANFGSYALAGRTAAGSATIAIRNLSGSSLSEAIVIKFIIIKAVVS